LTADLPDDLAVLADQLRADAKRLAARYPSPAPHRWGRRWAWVAAVAAVSFSAGLAGSSLAGWGWGRNGRSGNAGLTPAAGSADGPSVVARRTAPAELRLVREEEPALASQVADSAPKDALATTAARARNAESGATRSLDEAALLRRQVAAFEQVIERLQAELRARADQQSQTDAMVAELRQELAELRRRLEEQPRP
jgi:hypothetical protein